MEWQVHMFGNKVGKTKQRDDGNKYVAKSSEGAQEDPSGEVLKTHLLSYDTTVEEVVSNILTSVYNPPHTL